MAQTYTLEEAAQRLGLTPEVFKRRHKEEWKSLRSFRDGPTLRFRAPDIDELARTLGETSEPDLQLSPSGGLPDGESEVSFSFVDDAGPPAKPVKSKPPKGLVETDEEQPALGSGVNINRPKKPGSKAGDDSDVRLELSGGKSGGSGVKFDSNQPTEEIALDLSGPGSAIIRPGQSGKLAAPKSGPKSGKTPASKIPGAGGLSKPNNNDDASSEFELSLDADSDSFELQLASDEDEVDLGSDAGGDNVGALSGINLAKPSDSGLSLEPMDKPKGDPKSGPKTNPRTAATPVKAPPAPPKAPPSKAPPRTMRTAAPPADDDFDLSLDAPTAGPGTAPKSAPKPAPKSAPKSVRAPKSDRMLDSGSDFELTLDDGSGEMAKLAEGSKPAAEAEGDIFETDFELPAIDADSGSEVVAVDSDGDTDVASDFEMAIDDADAPIDEDESASQVVLVDDDGQAYSEEQAVEEDAFVSEQVEDEQEASISSVMRGRAARPDEDEEVEVRTVVAAPAKWGPLPAIVLLPTLLVTFLGGLMSFELVRGMWGYHQTSKPGNLIVRNVADQFGMKAAD